MSHTNQVLLISNAIQQAGSVFFDLIICRDCQAKTSHLYLGMKAKPGMVMRTSSQSSKARIPQGHTRLHPPHKVGHHPHSVKALLSTGKSSGTIMLVPSPMACKRVCKQSVGIHDMHVWVRLRSLKVGSSRPCYRMPGRCFGKSLKASTEEPVSVHLHSVTPHGLPDCVRQQNHK
jgi:hypothetical protein